MSIKVGVVGWDIAVGSNTPSIGVTFPYLAWAKYMGGAVKIISFEDIDNDVDVVVLPGGADVNPLRYGQGTDLYTGKANQFLETFDTLILPEYIKMGKPIFGICRGMQSLCVHFGGSMKQHMFFHTSSKDVNDTEAHELYYSNDGGATKRKLKEEHNNNKNFKIGSWHHQGVVDCGTLTPTHFAEEMTGSSHSFIIEAVKHHSAPIAAVQWHPERCYDNISSALFNSLLK